MQKFAVWLAAAIFLIAIVSPAFAQTKAMNGQLIDLGSYESGFSASQFLGVHARACALEGFPVGLLTADGKVYQITGEFAAHANAKIVRHMLAKSVTVTGEVTEKGEIGTIVASDIK